MSALLQPNKHQRTGISTRRPLTRSMAAASRSTAALASSASSLSGPAFNLRSHKTSPTHHKILCRAPVNTHPTAMGTITDDRGVQHAANPEAIVLKRAGGPVRPADLSTPAMQRQVHNAKGFTKGFFSDGCAYIRKGYTENSAVTVTVEFGQSNPSQLHSLKLFLDELCGCDESVLYSHPFNNGHHHDGHSEHSLRLKASTQSPKRRAAVRTLLEMLAEDPFKGYVAEQALLLLDIQDKNRHRSNKVVNIMLKPIMRNIQRFNSTGPAGRLFKYRHQQRGLLAAMPAEEFADYFGGFYAADGGCYVKLSGERCRPTGFLVKGRDGPGVVKIIRDKLGFGTLDSFKPNTSPEVGPDGHFTRLLFSTPSDLDKLDRLLSGQEVELACGTVPRTRSGLPRTAGKMMKLHTMLAYAATHTYTNSCGSQPGKLTMRRDSSEGVRGWWTEGRNWRHMARAMWPGIIIPDSEH